MYRIWDDAMKRVFGSRPQDFVAWLLPGGEYIDKVSLELKTLTRTITTDTLYKVILDREEVLLHVEFQKRPDKNMDKRLWEYNVLATLEYGCAVYSFVIYLTPGGKIPEPPLIWKHPARETIHYFCYWHIKLWEHSVEKLRELDLPGLLPLFVLTKDGQEKALVKQTFDELWQRQEKELLAMALTFASMVFQSGTDADWLGGEMQMYEDILSDSWFYQKILKKGEKQGLEQGIEQGLEQGMQSFLLDTIQLRFPTLLETSKARLKHLHDPEQLRQLHLALLQAQSFEDAEQALTHFAKDNE